MALETRIRERDPPGRADPVRRVRGGRAVRRPTTASSRAGGGAGRAGRDFVTSPEVGSAVRRGASPRALDDWWRRLGEPDPFVVVEAGAGRGRLARDVLRAAPECATALRYVLVERSRAAARRAARAARARAGRRGARPVPPPIDGESPSRRPGQRARSSPRSTTLPAVRDPRGRARQRAARQPAVRTSWSGPTTVGSRSGSASTATASSRCSSRLPGRSRPRPTSWPRARSSPSGARLPVPNGGRGLARARAPRCSRGARSSSSTTPTPRRSLAARGQRRGCARTAAHERGGDPLDDAGRRRTSPATCCSRPPPRRRAGRAPDRASTSRSASGWAASGSTSSSPRATAMWQEGAARGDLAALAGRSRGAEAAALTDPGRPRRPHRPRPRVKRCERSRRVRPIASTGSRPRP